ncbi:hypothetical protein [Vreelandella venusta]|uniref:hypothetical protein n=1 Tax=Vreelandella venusta TaxID=44935 RepID=UPI001172BCEA|nr:hypothetical protein [Halomonas venusta]GEK52353.1 hypothetical protein HVE01_30740 [Halomonas venusta]
MDNLPVEPSAPVTEDQLVNMSDEQINELDFSSFEQETAVASEEAPVVEETDDELTNPVDPELDDEAAEEDDTGEDVSADSAVEEDAADPAAEAPDEEATEADPKPDDTSASEVDYKAEYDKIFAPFNANGKEIRVDNADDAIRLMQMGANYAKKMSALKPNLKMLKMLENNQLLSEEKLNFYIDLEKKNPEAIKKFIKDSGVDPLDLDLDGKNEYTPGNHAVDDRAVDLDLVLDEIKDSPSYSKTLGIVSSKWDSASKQTIYEQPELLKVINSHVDNGVYDLISAEIERERMLGRLTNVSDLDAYRQVGDTIQARGGFNHLFKDSAPAEQAKPQTVVKKAAPKAAAKNQKLNEQRRAASPTTRSSTSNGPSADFNPLALSDEEFEKLNGLPI